MIRFYRKIRHSLLSDGKNGKYIKYAAGEIVLVVIGILIALQINNWNENRKANRKELLFLKEFVVSITTDLYNYEKQFEPRLERKRNGLDSLMKYIHKSEKLEDSLFLTFYSQLRQGIRLGFDNGPYEALKSSGLDFIRNDSIRTSINRTYTILPFFQFFSHEIDEDNNKRISDLEYKILGHIPSVNDGEKMSLQYALNVDDIINNQDFLWIYRLEEEKYNNYRFRLGQMKSVLIELRKLIQEELNHQ